MNNYDNIIQESQREEAHSNLQTDENLINNNKEDKTTLWLNSNKNENKFLKPKRTTILKSSKINEVSISSITEESNESFHSNLKSTTIKKISNHIKNDKKPEIEGDKAIKSDNIVKGDFKINKLNPKLFLKSKSGVVVDGTTGKIKKSQSNNYDDFVFDAEKKRKLKIKQLWNRFRYLTRGLISFQKLSRNIRLYGNSEEIFDANNPEKFEEKLKIIEDNNQLVDTNKNTKDREEINQGFCLKILKKIKDPINPDSVYLFYWSFYLILLMVYTAIFMPYYLAFVENEIMIWTVLENLVDFSFLFDILINFNTSYYEVNSSTQDNILITDRKLITKKYMKTWFAFDLLSSIPFSLIITSTVRITSTLIKFSKIPKLYRLLKMFRFMKMSKYLKKVNLIQKIISYFNFNFGMTKLISFLATTLVFSHIFGCLWYLLPRIFDEDNNWVIKFNLLDESPFRLYIFSLYYSFTTLFTVGFGDIYAVNEIERILSILWMLFGIGFYSFTIGTLSSVLADMDSRENKLKYKLSILNDFTKEANLSISLKDKIKKVLIFNSEKHTFSWAEKQTMFNELPINLKVDIAKSMKEGYLKDIPFFTVKDDSFVAMIVPFLLPWNIHEKETVYKVNDHPNQMYFIIKGRIFFVNEDFIPFKTMITGSYFGEIEIIFKIKRCHTTIAAENSELLTLSKQFYEQIIVKEYTEIHEEIKFISGVRNEKNREAEHYLNKTLAANKEKYNKNILGNIFDKKGVSQLLFSELIEIRRYKKEMEKYGLLKPRSQSFEIEKEIIQNDNLHTSLFQLDGNNDMTNIRHKPETYNLTKFQSNSVCTYVQNNLANDEENIEPQDSPYKQKIAFYNKLVASTKVGKEARRPSFVYKELMKNKMNNIQNDEPIVEEINSENSSSNKSYKSIRTKIKKLTLNISPSKSSPFNHKYSLNSLPKDDK